MKSLLSRSSWCARVVSWAMTTACTSVPVASNTPAWAQRSQRRSPSGRATTSSTSRRGALGVSRAAPTARLSSGRFPAVGGRDDVAEPVPQHPLRLPTGHADHRSGSTAPPRRRRRGRRCRRWSGRPPPRASRSARRAGAGGRPRAARHRARWPAGSAARARRGPGWSRCGSPARRARGGVPRPRARRPRPRPSPGPGPGADSAPPPAGSPASSAVLGRDEGTPPGRAGAEHDGLVVEGGVVVEGEQRQGVARRRRPRGPGAGTPRPARRPRAGRRGRATAPAAARSGRARGPAGPRSGRRRSGPRPGSTVNGSSSGALAARSTATVPRPTVATAMKRREPQPVADQRPDRLVLEGGEHAGEPDEVRRGEAGGADQQREQAPQAHPGVGGEHVQHRDHQRRGRRVVRRG